MKVLEGTYAATPAAARPARASVRDIGMRIASAPQDTRDGFERALDDRIFGDRPAGAGRKHDTWRPA